MARSIPAIVRLQGAIWPLHGAATVFGKPQAREVGFEAARQLTVVSQKKPSFMTAERLRALDVVGFDWGRTKADLVSLWNERFQELREFKAQFGHCNVPKLHSGNPQLAQWVSNQRRIYRKSTEENPSPLLYPDGTPSRVPAECIRALNGISFDWGQEELVGTNSLNNCANSRCTSATASCHTVMQPIPSSGSGFRISATTPRRITKESQVS